MSSILFPALLAGPIIRRVDSSQAYIWVATSKNYSILADCYEITTKYEGNQYDKITTRTRSKAVRFGENLYIHLIRIRPRRRFKAKQLIGYNLRFENKGESFDLEDLDLLNPMNPKNIIYSSLKYPSFYIAEENSSPSTKFLYGSCRKPHGEGEDALAFGDSQLEASCRNLSERPEALFLMGDQIYADDVPDTLFRQINILGKALMGKEEDLTVIDPRLSEEADRQHLNKINSRKTIIQSIANFTSGNCDNHLIQFGEYAAMYLLSWSSTLWELCDQYKLNETFDEAVENEHIHVRPESEKLKRMDMLQLKKRYTNQENNVVNYRESSYKVRRLLANIPTYMIFDDHDITDDWNITSEWKESVRTSPLGKHIVANGLAAYWAFQGWGNQPATFKMDFITQMEKYFRELLKGNKKVPYHTWAEMLWRHRPWYFVTPTNPKAIFLDTRTMREYDDHPISKVHEQLDLEVNPPQLVNELQLRGLSRQLRYSRWEKGSPLLIISATPVIGIELIEDIVTKFSLPLKMLGIHVETTFDMEAWRYNGVGLTKILYQLAKWKPGDCVILSGDVHYSFSVDSSITFAKGHQLKIKQLTSSPLKNMSFHKLGPLVKLTTTANLTIQDEETVYRYCDKSYQIHSVAKQKLPMNDFLWKDELTYDYTDPYSIMETENNVGQLSISSNQVENKFIKVELDE